VSLPLLAIAGLGGTLSMQAGGDGLLPALDAQALVAGLPQLAEWARVEAQTLQRLPSASLSLPQLLDVLHWAEAQVRAGAQGVVVAQGTDTLEESAWLLDLLWRHPQPLVFTGAMRAASQLGADGPANLLAAATVALACESRGRGVLVVFNDEVHGARHVRKQHALALGAFASPSHGPVGVLVEGRPHYRHPPCRRQPLPLPGPGDRPVALLEATLGADTLLLKRVLAVGYAGLVIAGMGAGHVPRAWAEPLGEIAPQIPVLIASRTGQGSTASRTYGFAGGEIDLQRRGAIMAGDLCPRKCRLLLWLLANTEAPGSVHERLLAWLAEAA
jgi:L-asparaginase